ncbi:MAG: LptF/LptG family permease [Chthonomonadaceae bacterium]|nr:LptF/LptG family permease [Chthonomonadaceae bacterium]
MKKLDRLVLSEMFGPWAFGVAMFTVLIMAGSFLFELTGYLARGVDFLTILRLTGLLLPGIMAKTFPMAVLLSGLLSFGRLSGDSEIVAIKAAGVSVLRIMVPVFIFGLGVSALTFVINERVVPPSTLSSLRIKNRIENQLRGKTAQAMADTHYENGKLKASFLANDFDFGNRTLEGVTITLFDDHRQPTAFLYVEQFQFTDTKHWEMRGKALLIPADGGSRIDFERAIPTGSPQAQRLLPNGIPGPDATPEELLAKKLSELDALPIDQMGEQIKQLKNTPDPAGQLKPQISNLEFGYWNKIALPLAGLVFGLVGAPLGIRSHRVAASAGFWQAVIIIFAYMVLARALAITAQGGRVPAIVASFLPILIGLFVAGYLIWKRDN